MFQENSIETCILSMVKQVTGPGWMHETSARTWCSGRTWRERVGREVRGGIRMGKTCEPQAFSIQCMTKFTTKIKKLKKKKLNCRKTVLISSLGIYQGLFIDLRPKVSSRAPFLINRNVIGAQESPSLKSPELTLW